MLNSGAYSKKYQHLAREMRDTQQRASKSARDRAQLLSKQTAQRQRALEEKKRAMALAEEARRRKALEERRKTQQEATMRFKSAITRLKAASKEQIAAPGKEMRVQFYLPDKPWDGVNTANYSTLTDKKSVEMTPQKATKPPERVITGREVEVTALENHRGLQRRIPSLDDVLRAVRGEGSVSTEPAAKSTHTNNQGSTAVGGMLRGRSASDPDLAVQSTLSQQSSSQPPTVQNGHYAQGSSQPPTVQNGHYAQSSSQPPTVQNGHFAQDASIDSTLQSSVADPQEGVVFHPVLKQVPPVANPRDELQVLSPETPDSGDSPADSLSDGSLQDSLDAAMAGIVRQQRYNQGDEKHSSCVPTQEGAANGRLSSMTSHLQRNAFQQPRPRATRYEEDSDSSSDGDCYLHTRKHMPPKSRRQTKLSNGPSMAEEAPQSSSEEDMPEPKLVGILKKPGSGSQSLKPSSGANSTGHSQGGSALSSVVTMTDGGSQNSSHGGAVEGGRANRRVRFLDQVDSPTGTVDSSVTSVLDPALDPAFFQVQLWSKVLRNGFSTRFPPNSAFTPKMRLSLSSKAAVAPRRPLPSPPNGITVHMPRAEPPPVGGSGASEVESSPEARSSQVGGSSMLQSAVLPGLEHDQPTAVPERGIPLDKTPTDDDINDLWTQIRAYFHGTGKVSIPPQVFRFLPEELVSSPASEEDQRTPPGRPPQLSRRQRQHPGPPGRLTQKQLVHRQYQPRPLRCQHQLHQPMPLWQRSTHSHTHPKVQVSAREPQQALKATGTSMGKRGPTTALSLEEQRLKHSIEKINQRLQDHSKQDLRSPDFDTPSHFPVRPPTPPIKHFSTRHPAHPPDSIRSRGPGDLPKTRVRRDPKVVALAATLHAQSLDFRSQTGATVHRPFQNS